MQEELYIILTMQRTLDLGLSTNARSLGQAVRHAKTREKQEKGRSMKQKETSQQLKPIKQVVFKHASQQHLRTTATTVDLIVQKQPAVRHALPQYTYNMGEASSWMPFSTNRPTFDLARVNKPISGRQQQAIRRLQRSNQRTAEHFFRDAIHDEFVAMSLTRMKRTLYTQIYRHLTSTLHDRYSKNDCSSSAALYKAYLSGDISAQRACIRAYIETQRHRIEKDEWVDETKGQVGERIKDKSDVHIDEFKKTGPNIEAGDYIEDGG